MGRDRFDSDAAPQFGDSILVSVVDEDRVDVTSTTQVVNSCQVQLGTVQVEYNIPGRSTQVGHLRQQEDSVP